MDFIKGIILQKNQTLQIRYSLEQGDSTQFMIKKPLIYFKKCYCMSLKLLTNFEWTESVIFYFLNPEFPLKTIEEPLRVS